MAKNNLLGILESLGEEIKKKGLVLKVSDNIFYRFLNENCPSIDYFKKLIKSDWENFQFKNKDYSIPKSYTTFFYLNFDKYFRFFSGELCGLNKKSIKLIRKEKISDDNLFLEYSYSLSKEENRWFNEFSENYSDLINGITTPTGYLFLIVSSLHITIRKVIREQFSISLDGAIIKKNSSKSELDFLIVIKNSKDDVYKNYYYMFLYYFLRRYKEIPQSYINKLLEGRNNLYQLALNEYPQAKEKLTDLLYYFYKKCTLLRNFSPILDFFNFVCSRVEDSVFSKESIIFENVLNNLGYSEKKNKAILNIFNFLDKASTLYSTFQANNLPNQRNQINLFQLYLKYYFGNSTLEDLESKELLFLPDRFSEKIEQYNLKLKYKINSETIVNFQKFLEILALISVVNDNELIFKKIFKQDINRLNFYFFKTFLHSLNLKILEVIAKENKKLIEKYNEGGFSFEDVVDHVCRMLFVLIDKIFIRKTPNQASKNFIDPRSRYIGRNIALRVLELFIFQDFNVSDDVWPDFIISINKDSLLRDLKKFKIDISENDFYNSEDIVRFVNTYNFHVINEQMLLEEWLIKSLLVPFNDFYYKIKNSLKKKDDKDEIRSILMKFFVSDDDAKEMKEMQDLDFKISQLSELWIT